MTTCNPVNLALDIRMAREGLIWFYNEQNITTLAKGLQLFRPCTL